MTHEQLNDSETDYQKTGPRLQALVNDVIKRYQVGVPKNSYFRAFHLVASARNEYGTAYIISPIIKPTSFFHKLLGRLASEPAETSLRLHLESFRSDTRTEAIDVEDHTFRFDHGQNKATIDTRVSTRVGFPEGTYELSGDNIDWLRKVMGNGAWQLDIHHFSEDWLLRKGSDD